MPFNNQSGRFERVWNFVDQRETGDDITRTDLDVMANDLANGITDVAALHLQYVGEWNPEIASFPASRPNGGRILARDAFVATAGGTVGGIDFEAGETLVALVPDPGQTYAARWLRLPFLSLPAAISAAEGARDAAQAAQAATEDERDAADAAASLAAGYAQTPEDTTVPGGAGYSALHYAAKAGADRSAAALSAAQAALYDGPRRITVQQLLLDTTLTYTGGSPSTVAPGDSVRVDIGGFAYLVAASGATDYDIVTAGGVRLYVVAGAGGFDVRAFGAAADGVTNDAGAFDKAIARLNAISTSETLILRGNFVVLGSLSPITSRRKIISAYGATINHHGGTLFTFGVGGNVGFVLGLQYFCPSSPTLPTCLLDFDGANQCGARDITGRVDQLAKVGLSNFVGGYILENVNLSTVNGSQVIIDHGHGAVSQINNLVLTAIGTSRALDQTTLSGATATAIRFSDAWDTGIWSGLLINGYLYGLLVDRTVANVNISNFKISNFFLDFCANGICMKNTASGGGINNWHFINGWVVGMDGYGIDIRDGTFGDIKFTSVTSMLAGKNNWRLSAGALSDVVLNDCTGQFANRLSATNTGSDQDDFVALLGNFRVHNSRFGRSADGVVAAGVPNWQGRYGANIAPNVGPYSFEGNMVTGKTADTSITIGTTTPSGSARSCIVRNNRTASGAAAVNYATGGTVTVPTSGALQTNLTPLTMRMHVFGGTVSQVQHEGVQIGGANGASFILEPGQTWQVNYSVAPTITRVVKP